MDCVEQKEALMGKSLRYMGSWKKVIILSVLAQESPG